MVQPTFQLVFFSNMNWQMFWLTKKSPTIIINIGTVTNQYRDRGWILEIFSTSTFSYPNNSYSFTMCKAHACISLAITATHRCLWRLCRLDAGTTRGCLLKIFSTRLEKNAFRDKTSNQVNKYEGLGETGGSWETGVRIDRGKGRQEGQGRQGVRIDRG